MKTNVFCRRQQLIIAGMTLILAASGPNAWSASPDELLEKGIYTEETRGDLKAASRIYQQIADDPEAERNLVAQAQLRLGFCELKLGKKKQNNSPPRRRRPRQPS